MDSEIINDINEPTEQDASSPIVDENPDSKVMYESGGVLPDESICCEQSDSPVSTLDTIFSKLSMDKGCECNSSCNQSTDDYNALLNKYDELNEVHKQNLLAYNDCQYKYADAIGERDTKIAQLQQMRQIDMEYNTQCKETYDGTIIKLNSVISSQNIDIEEQRATINLLTSKLQEINKEIDEVQMQYKKEIDSRTNKSYNEIAELHNTNVLITQQLNEKTNESDKLREKNTELITQINQYSSFSNKPIQNDKNCIIQ